MRRFRDAAFSGCFLTVLASGCGGQLGDDPQGTRAAEYLRTPQNGYYTFVHYKQAGGHWAMDDWGCEGQNTNLRGWIGDNDNGTGNCPLFYVARAGMSSWYTIEKTAYSILTDIGWQTVPAQYLCAENGGGGSVYANRSSADIWEKFVFQAIDSSLTAIQTYNGHYLSALNDGNNSVDSHASQIGPWEQWVLVFVGY